LYALGPKCAGRVSSRFFFFFYFVMKVENRWIRLRHFRSKPCGMKLIKISREAGSLIWSEEEKNLRTPEAARTGN
jgi:hypothetical protein